MVEDSSHLPLPEKQTKQGWRRVWNQCWCSNDYYDKNAINNLCTCASCCQRHEIQINETCALPVRRSRSTSQIVIACRDRHHLHVPAFSTKVHLYRLELAICSELTFDVDLPPDYFSGVRINTFAHHAWLSNELQCITLDAVVYKLPTRCFCRL